MSYDPPNEMIHTKLHALISTLEQLADSGQFGGEPEALLDLVDCAGHDRPVMQGNITPFAVNAAYRSSLSTVSSQEASTMRLVSARAASLSPASSEWVGAALALADKYLRHEPRINVRTHTLDQLMAFIHRNR